MNQAGDADYNAAAQVSRRDGAEGGSDDHRDARPRRRAAVFKTRFTWRRRAAGSRGTRSYVSAAASCRERRAPAVTMTSGIGVCSVMYDQAGDDNYNAGAAGRARPSNASKADQTITVTTPRSGERGLRSQFTVAATARLGEPR